MITRISLIGSLMFATVTAVAAPEPTYTWINKNIIQPKCASCHDFSTYESLIEDVLPGRADQSPLYTETKNGSMPMGGEPLTEDELDAIQQWIQDGAPNN